MHSSSPPGQGIDSALHDHELDHVGEARPEVRAAEREVQRSEARRVTTTRTAVACSGEQCAERPALRVEVPVRLRGRGQFVMELEPDEWLPIGGEEEA
ncbi:MAG: hypothetical protein REI11_18705, partial [Patulibacter sp.]|nr:hypothetical protein [Patulibacter sp.]